MAKQATATKASPSSFSDILKTKRGEVDRPTPMPVGPKGTGTIAAVATSG